jgi:hypothetical protein
MDSRDHDKLWKKTLKEGEAIPHASVWHTIALQLDGQEVVALRKRVTIYKWLVAASVSFAMIVGVISYSLVDFSNKTMSIVNQVDKIESKNVQHFNRKLDTASFVSESGMPPQSPLVFSTSSSSKIEKYATPNTIATIDETTLTPNKRPLRFSMEKKYSVYDGTDTDFNKKVATYLPASIDNPEELIVDKALLDEEAIAALAPTRKEKFWTAVGFSAGTFSNTTPSDPSAPSTILRSAVAGNTAASESNTSGYTYSINVALGTKISKRWLLQGGLSYIAQLSDYTATSVLSDPSATSAMLAAASLNQFEKQIEDKTDQSTILASTPYSVNNTIQIISFPVQAGYILFERKLALQINSGLATDLFIQNTITPDAENLETTTQGRGETSPYRPVNISGLIGTELSYKVGQNYRVALSPGLRYPFNSIYKTDLGIRSTPLTFDVALRFRYIFK